MPSQRSTYRLRGLCTTDEPNERVVYELLNQWYFRICIQPLPAWPLLFDYAGRVRETGNISVPLILGRRVWQTNHVCHWKDDTRVCVEWENIEQSVCVVRRLLSMSGGYLSFEDALARTSCTSSLCGIAKYAIKRDNLKQVPQSEAKKPSETVPCLLNYCTSAGGDMQLRRPRREAPGTHRHAIGRQGEGTRPPDS